MKTRQLSLLRTLLALAGVAAGASFFFFPLAWWGPLGALSASLRDSPHLLDALFSLPPLLCLIPLLRMLPACWRSVGGARRALLAGLAVPAIAQAENITVSNEEVDAEYARLARLHGNPEEEIRRVLARDAVAAAITNQKVQRFLLDHAAVTSIVEKE